jgi:hypothetical protein
MFKAAWNTSFSEKNIISAFTKTGIFPYNPSVVLDKITHLVLPPALVSQEHTPMTYYSIWRMYKAYKKSPIAKQLTFILNANSYLVA